MSEQPPYLSAQRVSPLSGCTSMPGGTERRFHSQRRRVYRSPAALGPGGVDRYEVPGDWAQGEPTWIRSFSHGADHTCVEVAFCRGSVRVRDSKDPAGPALRFSRREWEAFLLGSVQAMSAQWAPIPK